MPIKTYITLLLGSILFISCNPESPATTEKPKLADPDALPATVALFERMTALMDRGIMLGHQDALAYGHNWYDEPNRSDIHDVTGKYPAVVGWEIGHIEIGSGYNLDSIYFDNMKRYIREAHERGSINTISWHGDNIATGGTSWDCGQDTVVSSILPGGINHEKYLLWLDRVAAFLLDLKDSEGELIPVMFRIYHEQTGSWFWWGAKQCTTEEYIALWRMTVTYLRDHCRVHNLLYSYSPSQVNSPEEYLERYPGNDYVDVVGFDCYAYGEGETFSEEKLAEVMGKYLQTLQYNLDIVCRFAEKNGKIPALSETGAEQFPYPGTFSEVIYQAIKDYRISYILFWRNAFNRPSHYYVPFEGNGIADDFRKFVSFENILTTDEL